MLSDSPIYSSKGIISSGIALDDSLKAVVTFLNHQCRIFSELNKGATDMNEKGLSQKLCILLNRKAKNYPFFFQSEFMENINSGSSPQVDIGTISIDDMIEVLDKEYNGDDSFFSLEAKRLPTVGWKRDQEYVSGFSVSSGGIERFKKGLHGPRLKVAAIIGYVQDKNFAHWFLEINSWIDKLAADKDQTLWSKDDKIQKTGNEDDGFYIQLASENKRIVNGSDAEKITLYHFWINLVP